jgi:hypothetical protein
MTQITQAVSSACGDFIVNLTVQQGKLSGIATVVAGRNPFRIWYCVLMERLLVMPLADMSARGTFNIYRLWEFSGDVANVAVTTPACLGDVRAAQGTRLRSNRESVALAGNISLWLKPFTAQRCGISHRLTSRAHPMEAGQPRCRAGYLALACCLALATLMMQPKPSQAQKQDPFQSVAPESTAFPAKPPPRRRAAPRQRKSQDVPAPFPDSVAPAAQRVAGPPGRSCRL